MRCNLDLTIIYDLAATQPNESKFHGGGEYAKTVFLKLLTIRKDEKIVGFYNPTKELDSQIKNVALSNGVDLIAIKSKKELQHFLKEGNFQLFYSALPYNYYDIDFANLKVVFTIHGLRAIEMPTDKYELFYKRSFRDIAKRSFKMLFKQNYVAKKKEEFAKLLSINAKDKLIIVPSYHTKYALLEYFPNIIDPAKIKVFYSPEKMITGVANQVLLFEKYKTKSRGYFLIISADRWIKNPIRAIIALDSVFSKFPSIDKDVIVLGAKDTSRIYKYIKNKNRFKFFAYVDDKELELLYQNAYLFIYPTLNEGFGYPPLECMKYGTPVICSAITSITEICGDAVCYFNPFSVDEIENRILYMLFENEVWDCYAQKGRQRYEYIAAKQDLMLTELCQILLGIK